MGRLVCANHNERVLVLIMGLFPAVQWALCPEHWRVPFRPPIWLIALLATVILCIFYLTHPNNKHAKEMSESVSRFLRNYLFAFIFPMQLVCIGYARQPASPSATALLALTIWSTIGTIVAILSYQRSKVF
jgi:hypothetical protein